MSIKFEKIKPGMRLMDIHSHAMGNTTIRTLGLWYVDIVSVAADTAIVRWNGNREETWHRVRLERLYTKKTKKLIQQEERKKNGSWY